MEVFQKKKMAWNGICRSRGWLFLGAFLTAMALNVHMEVADIAEEGISNSLYLKVYKILETVRQGTEGKGLPVTVLTICLYVCYRKVWREKDTQTVRYGKGLALFLAAMYAGGVGFAFGNSLSVLYTSSARLLKTMVLIAGFYSLYLTAIHAFYEFLVSRRDIRMKESKWLTLYRRHPFASAWAGIMLSWLLHLVLRYPGVMSYDNWNQLAYYFGYRKYTTAQPVFHTWLFGIFVKLGTMLGSGNIGLFAFVLMQSAVMAGVLAWSLVCMGKWKAPAWLRLLAMGIYCFMPCYAGYAAFPIKDFLYTACFLLFVLLCMEWFRKPQEFWKEHWYKAAWAVSACLMILFRKNGIAVYLPVAFAVGFSMMKRGISEKRTAWPAAAVIGLLAPVMLAFGIEGIIGSVYHVEKDGPKEMFSLPFQQTARYVRDYGEEIPEEEKEIIRQVLDYDNLPALYLESSADPVKTSFRGDGTEALTDYFGVWFRQFLRHPLCYAEATWNQNYYLFAPNIDNYVFNRDCHIGEEYVMEDGLGEAVRFEIPVWMQGLCPVMVSFYSFLSEVPVIGMLSNVAFYVILMFVTGIFMLHEKRGKEWFVLLPLILTFFIILAGPQVINQPRYAFPIVYAMPSVLAFYMRAGRSTPQEVNGKGGMK